MLGSAWGTLQGNLNLSSFCKTEFINISCLFLLSVCGVFVPFAELKILIIYIGIVYNINKNEEIPALSENDIFIIRINSESVR